MNEIMATTVNQLRKEGKLNLAYEMAVQQLNDNKNYSPYQEDMLWVYYAYLKNAVEIKDIDKLFRIIEKVCELNKTDIQMFNDSLNWQLVKLINSKDLNSNEQVKLVEILKMCQSLIMKQQASKSKSILIKMMVKNMKTIDGFWSFFSFLEKKHYLNEDFESTEYNGKKIMSIYEQMLYAYIKSWLKDAEKGKSDAFATIDNILDTINSIEILDKYRFIRFYYAKVLLLAHRNIEAIDVARSFLRSSINQSYAWSLMANCTDDIEHKIAYLSKALSLQKDEKFSVGILNNLMDIFVEQQEADISANIASRIIKIRKEQSWPILSEIYKVEQGRIGVIKDEEISKKITNDANKAINFCFENAKSTIAVITGNKANTLFYFLFDTEGNTYKVRLSKGLDTGQFIQLITDKKVLEAKSIDTPSEVKGAIKKFKGNLKQIKEFGFVKNVFISPQLSKSIENGAYIQGIAIREINKKTKKEGWKAICIS